MRAFHENRLLQLVVAKSLTQTSGVIEAFYHSSSGTPSTPCGIPGTLPGWSFWLEQKILPGTKFPCWAKAAEVLAEGIGPKWRNDGDGGPWFCFLAVIEGEEHKWNIAWGEQIERHHMQQKTASWQKTHAHTQTHTGKRCLSAATCQPARCSCAIVLGLSPLPAHRCPHDGEKEGRRERSELGGANGRRWQSYHGDRRTTRSAF